MHSTSTEEALLVRITLASCFKWSRPLNAFFQKISGSSSTSSPTFACKYMHLLQCDCGSDSTRCFSRSRRRLTISYWWQLPVGRWLYDNPQTQYTLHINIEKRRRRCVYDWRGFKIWLAASTQSHANDWLRLHTKWLAAAAWWWRRRSLLKSRVRTRKLSGFETLLIYCNWR